MDDLRRLEYLREPACRGSAADRRVRDTDLAALRAQIDDVDARLAALLEERAAAGRSQVQQHASATTHGHDVARERALLERAAAGEAACSRRRSVRGLRGRPPCLALGAAREADAAAARSRRPRPQRPAA